ncbi:TetR/AcrR family transcriptional regulator [Saccharothrix coeruleofusca]|uniref:TetR family transcriptional regulator n=1 Tax=Saccharothrix coeruleofusca TaxID=33919 RepID=A0A918AIR3_9PSEU|nr:TetR/AcrR family transcriptional regulator [Saccharothrix coeruleofusca]GGP43334.1 TetR family transcriptional regulator [Saccharothrix coeruleofusca]
MANDQAPPARARNPRDGGSRLRERIVAAAAELLDETGDGTAISLRSVARRAGIAAPSIYRHFPDRSAIVLAAVRRAFAELEAALRHGLAAAGDDPRRRLFAVCDGYLDFARWHPERYRAMFGRARMPAPSGTSPTAADLAALGDGCLTLLREVLEECARAGHTTSAEPITGAVALWLGLHGLAHQSAVSTNFAWPAGTARRVITALAHLNDTGARGRCVETEIEARRP